MGSHILRKRHKKHGKRVRRWFIACGLMLMLLLVVLSQGNGETGAWFADTFRVVLGPTATAQVESWYLGLTDFVHQTQYQLNGKKVAAPWKVGPTPGAKAPSMASASHFMPKGQPGSMSLPQITPPVTPAIAGEGAWVIQGVAPGKYNYLPLVAKTFVRPDTTHPYAVVTMLQFDTRFVQLHMVAGTSEPGGARGMYGAGIIPSVDQAGNALVAAFNGGFKYADGQYGMMVNGVVYVPPLPGVATIAVTKEGNIILGAWGKDPQLNSGNTDLAAWRQNASLLINHGVINPLTQDGAAWGGTILNSAYTWRSGIGITAQGTLLYAAGNSLTARTLAIALHAAGAVMAMQTDINPYWVRAFLYNRDSQGGRTIIKLNPAMQGTGTEYLNGTARDFFYLTRVVPSHVSLYP